MTDLRALRRTVNRFRRDRSGVSAIEFALIAPVFLFFLFGTFEVTLSAWYGSVLYESADRGARYMREERMERRTVSASGLRSAICAFSSKGGMPCDESKLKIALYVADDPVAKPIVIPQIIDNVTPSLTARTYVLAVAFEWPFALPTSKLLLRSNGTRVQVLVRTFVTPDERPIEQ